MKHILIRAKKEVVEHKMRDVADPRFEKSAYAYWTGKAPAAQHQDIFNVYISDGDEIFAEAKYLPEETKRDGQLCFTLLERVRKRQPRKPPTRGWCYIEETPQTIHITRDRELE